MSLTTLLCLGVVLSSQDADPVKVTISARAAETSLHERQLLSRLRLLAPVLTGPSSSTDRERALAELASDARDGDLPELAAFFDRVRRANTTAELEKAWFEARWRSLVIVLKPSVETWPLEVIHVGRVVDSEQRELNAITGDLRRFQDKIVGSGLPIAEAMPGKFIVADLLFRQGKNVASASPAAYLPYHPSSPTPRSFVFWRNVTIRAWHEPNLKRIAEAVIEAPVPSGSAVHRLYSTRFAMYPMGRRSEPDWAPPRRQLDSLSIAKADVLAALALREYGFTSRDALATLVLMSLAGLRDALNGRAPAPHEGASLLTLNYLAELKAVSTHAEIIRIDASRASEALTTLAKGLIRLEADESELELDQFLTRYAERAAPFRQVLERLMALPTVPVEIAIED